MVKGIMLHTVCWASFDMVPKHSFRSALYEKLVISFDTLNKRNNREPLNNLLKNPFNNEFISYYLKSKKDLGLYQELRETIIGNNLLYKPHTWGYINRGISDLKRDLKRDSLDKKNSIKMIKELYTIFEHYLSKAPGCVYQSQCKKIYENIFIEYTICSTIEQFEMKQFEIKLLSHLLHARLALKKLIT